MSRCGRTDALLDAIFSDTGPTASQARHLAACPECARLLALARRFDGELHHVGGELAELHTTDGSEANRLREHESKGGRDVWGAPLPLGKAALVVAIAVLGVVALSNAPLGQLQPGIGADELTLWLERAGAVTHEELDVGGQTELDEWEPAQVEICGDTVLAFFERSEQPDIGYRWAVGRPGNLLDHAIETGRSRTLAAPDVAQRRAALPVCAVALGSDGPAALGTDFELAPQEVVRVPDLRWMGDPNHAPFEVEIIDAQQDVLVLEHWVFSDGHLVGRLDDPSIRAIDLVTDAGRYRYSVTAPAFVIQADLGDGQMRYGLLDASGAVVAEGLVRDLEARARAQAEAAATAEAARRALEARPGAATCAGWARMTADEQLSQTEGLVADLVERVRTRQHLPADASLAEIMASARAGLDRECQASPASRALEDIADELYGDG